MRAAVDAQVCIVHAVETVRETKKKEGNASHMPGNVNHVRVHEVLAYNLFNVIMLVQETMQKIVSDNSLACYIIYRAPCGEKYRITNHLLVDETKDVVFYSTLLIQIQ